MPPIPEPAMVISGYPNKILIIAYRTLATTLESFIHIAVTIPLTSGSVIKRRGAMMNSMNPQGIDRIRPVRRVKKIVAIVTFRSLTAKPSIMTIYHIIVR